MEKSPIYGRNYYTDAEYQLEQGFMMEYLHKVTNDFVLLYKIDKVKTDTKNIYGETKASQKRFSPKVELPAKVNVDEQDPKFQSEGIGYSEMLNITFSIPTLSLEQNNVSIDIGDYVRWRDRFYEVTKAHNINEASKYSKNYRSKMRTYRGIMAKGDTIPKNLLEDNEIN